MSTFEIRDGRLLLDGEPVQWPVEIRDEENSFDMGNLGVSTHITKGFRMAFENGWTLSVQWGNYTYCGNYTIHDRPFEYASPDAEIAIWDREKDWLVDHREEWADQVYGYVPVDHIAKRIIPCLALLPTEPTDQQRHALIDLIKDAQREWERA